MTKKGCCVIPQCRNSSEKTSSSEVIYQKFPTKEKIRRRWIRAIQGTFKFFNIDGSSTPRVCSDHFADREFTPGKNGKRIIKLDAVPTIFTSNLKKEGSIKKEKSAPPPTQSEVGVGAVRGRRQASKEALKQMQIILDDDDDDPVEIPDDDYDYKRDLVEDLPIQVVMSPPKKKYKLTHRKSSDGNDREVLVLKTIQPPAHHPPSLTPSITNHYVENNLELECWVEELEPCQKERNEKLLEEKKALEAKLEELVKGCKGEVVYKGDFTSIIEVAEDVQKTITAVQASQNKPPLVLNSAVATPGYQLVMDPRMGVIVGTVAGPGAGNPTPKVPKIQVASNLQATPVTTVSQGATSVRTRTVRGKKMTQPTPVPPPATPVATISTRSVLKKVVPPTTSATAPVTRSREAVTVVATPPATRSREAVTVVATPPATRSRPTIVSNSRPTESNVEGGLLTGTTPKTKAIVDLTTDDGRPLPDSREISFNKLQGKTFPSLVVVARPHLRVTDVNSDRPKLDSKVKSVLMYPPTKFTEWLIQQGLVKSEQKCSAHPSTKLKLGMYSDVSKFPYSGGYVWISECCPQRFVSVFSGSIFEGSSHPPLVILKILYHWACQTNIQNVTQWVKVDNLYVKGMYTWLRSICTVALQTHIRQLGGPQTKVEVGVISLGTTSQDGNSRQVKVEVLGVLETTTKLMKLRAIEPLADGDRNYKKRFSKILEPLAQWVHPNSYIITDLTVDKATLHSMGFSNVIQNTSGEGASSNKTIMEYLRRIVPRMFQNTLSLLSRQIIQQFLDELVWREWFGTTSMQAFDNLISHVAEQTRHEAAFSLVVRLNRVALNPFKNWAVPPTSDTVVPPAVPPTTIRNLDIAKKRKRNTTEPSITQQELNRPPKSTSPDVPEQMVPLENYYYGTIDNYPPKTNVKLMLKCPFCKEVYNNNIQLMGHLFKHAHNNKDGEMCRYCLTSVPTANDLLKHIAFTHPSETKHDNGFICLICETQYMNPFVLGKHMSKEHCPLELPYQCGTCGYRCSNHKQAIDHFYKQHDNGPTIQCPFCLKSTTVFSSSRNIAQNMHYFIQHLQKHQRKQYAKRCGKCNLWFIQKEALKEHQNKMHVSQRGKTGLVSWVAPRNGVMVPKSKTDIYPCDAEAINFTNLFFNVSKDLKCKECNGAMDSTKHFPSFESCQHCQYSTCCIKAMQEHNSKCTKNCQKDIPVNKLPCKMFCICGFSSQDGNQVAKHLALCEKKSAYPSLSEAKSASVTHSMLDVLGLVRKPEEGDKKLKTTTKTVTETETITIEEDEPEVEATKPTKKFKKSSKNDGEKDLKESEAKPEKINENIEETEVAFVEEHDDEPKTKVEETDMLAMDEDVTKNLEEPKETETAQVNSVIISEEDATKNSIINEEDVTKNSEGVEPPEKVAMVQNDDNAINEGEKDDLQTINVRSDKEDDVEIIEDNAELAEKIKENEEAKPNEPILENNAESQEPNKGTIKETSKEIFEETSKEPEVIGGENLNAMEKADNESEDKEMIENEAEAIKDVIEHVLDSPAEIMDSIEAVSEVKMDVVSEAKMDVDSPSNEPMDLDDVSNSVAAMETD